MVGNAALRAVNVTLHTQSSAAALTWQVEDFPDVYIDK